MKIITILTVVFCFVAISIEAMWVEGYLITYWPVYFSFLLAVDAFTMSMSYVASKTTNYNFRRKFWRRAVIALIISLVWGYTLDGIIEGYYVLANIILYATFYNFSWDFWYAYWSYKKSPIPTKYIEFLGYGWVFKGALFLGATVLWFITKNQI